MVGNEDTRGSSPHVDRPFDAASLEDALREGGPSLSAAQWQAPGIQMYHDAEPVVKDPTVCIITKLNIGGWLDR